ncbi:MAG: 3-dehydroquinate synthase [Caldicoprobacterales bacterium]
MKRILVDLGQRSYPIYIHDNWNALFQKAFPCLNKGVSLNQKKVLIITDEHVYGLYHHFVEENLKSWGAEVHTAVVLPGEASKSLQQAEELYTTALEANLDRHSIIAALGGGVIGDLAGFIASTYMRGIPFIQIPTSLLAQVDSSVGGKVAVNHPLAKNVIGAFYQPECVLINVAVLKTLPGREFTSGMAELIKHGIIRDQDFLAWMEDHQQAIAAQDPSILAGAIHRSCEIKADVVKQDERESGLRAILNFGHTIGHAIEAAFGYGTFTHGEAVSIGMAAEAHIAHLLGLVSAEYVSRISALLAAAGLPVTLPDVDNHLILKWMQHDKKNVGNKIVFVLPTAPGQAAVFRDVKAEVILEALNAVSC